MGDEQLVFHPERNQAFHLNPCLAKIWNLCDGDRTVAEIAALLEELPAEKRRTAADQGLQQLADNGLLQNWRGSTRPALSRRKLLQGLGRAAAVTPLLTMVLVPPGVAAASGVTDPCASCGGPVNPCPNGCPCLLSTDCSSGNCTRLGTCGPPIGI